MMMMIIIIIHKIKARLVEGVSGFSITSTSISIISAQEGMQENEACARIDKVSITDYFFSCSLTVMVLTCF